MLRQAKAGCVFKSRSLNYHHLRRPGYISTQARSCRVSVTAVENRAWTETWSLSMTSTGTHPWESSRYTYPTLIVSFISLFLPCHLITIWFFIQESKGYFVHHFAPSDLPRIPKNVVFIIDRSGSMHGRKMEQVCLCFECVACCNDAKGLTTEHCTYISIQCM